MDANAKAPCFEEEVSIWIEFELSKSDKLTDNKWVDFFRPVRMTSGHHISFWGPIRERQSPNNTMLLVQVWKSYKELEQFRVSDQYRPFWSVLSAISEPKVRWFRPYGMQAHKSLKRTTSLVTAYFPWPISESQMKLIENLESIWAGHMGFNAHRHAPLMQIPTKLWAAEPEERYGQKVQVMIWLHPWMTAEKEYEFKGTVAYLQARHQNVDATNLTGMEEVYQRLKDAGSVACIEEHCVFEYIPEIVRNGVNSRLGI